MTTLREFRPGLWLTEVTLDEFAVRGAVVRGLGMPLHAFCVHVSRNGAETDP